jgi:hypothetical protein
VITHHIRKGQGQNQNRRVLLREGEENENIRILGLQEKSISHNTHAYLYLSNVVKSMSVPRPFYSYHLPLPL